VSKCLFFVIPSQGTVAQCLWPVIPVEAGIQTRFALARDPILRTLTYSLRLPLYPLSSLPSQNLSSPTKISQINDTGILHTPIREDPGSVYPLFMMVPIKEVSGHSIFVCRCTRLLAGGHLPTNKNFSLSPRRLCGETFFYLISPLLLLNMALHQILIENICTSYSGFACSISNLVNLSA
jgi:hypothetical protein